MKKKLKKEGESINIMDLMISKSDESDKKSDTKSITCESVSTTSNPDAIEVVPATEETTHVPPTLVITEIKPKEPKITYEQYKRLQKEAMEREKELLENIHLLNKECEIVEKDDTIKQRWYRHLLDTGLWKSRDELDETTVYDVFEAIKDLVKLIHESNKEKASLKKRIHLLEATLLKGLTKDVKDYDSSNSEETNDYYDY